jgi:hypothetical protein
LILVVQAFCYGTIGSLQYTSMNTLTYADINEEQTSNASSIASTKQQMSISFWGCVGRSCDRVFHSRPRSHQPLGNDSRHPPGAFGAWRFHYLVHDHLSQIETW